MLQLVGKFEEARKTWWLLLQSSKQSAASAGDADSSLVPKLRSYWLQLLSLHSSTRRSLGSAANTLMQPTNSQIVFKAKERKPQVLASANMWLRAKRIGTWYNPCAIHWYLLLISFPPEDDQGGRRMVMYRLSLEVLSSDRMEVSIKETARAKAWGFSLFKSLRASQ